MLSSVIVNVSVSVRYASQMNGFGFDLKVLGPLVHQLVQDLTTVRGVWSAVALLACLALARWGALLIQRRLADRPRGQLVADWARRVIWPMLALVLLWVARSVLERAVPIGLLSVGISLMFALAVIRTLVLLLRQTFSQARWVASFERLITSTVWALVALHVLGLLPVLVETLESIAIPLGKTRLTAMQAITGLVTVALATVIALWLSRTIDQKLATTRVDAGARVVIGRIAQPLLLLLALMIALPMVGIDLTTLSVFGGALGVGLGFGMQKIAANYVSGFILLLDRSIEPGRLIRVGSNRGIVADIRTRYTVLRGLDGVDAIVPNEMIVGSVVESETFTNTRQRIAVQVGVAYASDVEKAMALMVQAAAAQPRVLADPGPTAFLVAFADSSINLEVGFWIEDPTAGTLLLRSDINLAILRSFREAGIEIPFPQREVTLRTAAASDQPHA